MKKLITLMLLFMGSITGVYAQTFDFSCADRETIAHVYVPGVSLSFDGFTIENGTIANQDNFTIPEAYYVGLELDGLEVGLNTSKPLTPWIITASFSVSPIVLDQNHETLLSAINELRRITGRDLITLATWDSATYRTLIYNGVTYSGDHFSIGGIIAVDFTIINGTLFLTTDNVNANPVVWSVRRATAAGAFTNVTFEQAIANLNLGPNWTP